MIRLFLWEKPQIEEVKHGKQGQAGFTWHFGGFPKRLHTGGDSSFQNFQSRTFPPLSGLSLTGQSCLFAGTQDARGYRQWQQAGRHVKKRC